MIVTILLSSASLVLESVHSMSTSSVHVYIEAVSVTVFTSELILRLICAPNLKLVYGVRRLHVLWMCERSCAVDV